MDKSSRFAKERENREQKSGPDHTEWCARLTEHSLVVVVVCGCVCGGGERGKGKEE